MAHEHNHDHDHHGHPHKPGTMDITVQEKTFEGFVRFTTWSVILIVVFLLLLAMIGG